MENTSLNVNEKLIMSDMISFVMTENCPYQCAHCMRGDRRPNTISEAVIDIILSQVKIYGDVHLTGGESLLAVKRIAYLINQIYKLGNKPKRVSVITNGSIGPSKFEKFINVMKGREVELKLMVSDDYYHKKERERLNDGKDNILDTVNKYKEIIKNCGSASFIDDVSLILETYDSFESGRGVIAIGRGENIAGSEDYTRDYDLHKEARLVKKEITGRLQVHTNGIITPLFDMSWEERDKYYDQGYSCLEHPLIKILERK